MNARGLARPTALIAMMMLVAVVGAFAMFGQTEPLSATTSLTGAQARALAESGLVRALWALNNPEDRVNGIPDPLVGTAVNYNGTQWFDLTSDGSFTILVKAVPDAANERDVIVTGRASDPVSHRQAFRKLTARVIRLRTEPHSLFETWVVRGGAPTF